MKNKKSRQAKILELIKSFSVETQDELTEKLNEAGFETTQATVSRDIRELNLVKSQGPVGVSRYAVPDDGVQPTQQLAIRKYQNILSDSVISAVPAQNLVVLRCYVGMAQAACAALDAIGNKHIVGTLAGEDTVFIAANDNDGAAEIARFINDQKSI